jgi:hypothetical protein
VAGGVATVDQVVRSRHYYRIQVGMTLQQVEAILGPAATTQTEDVPQADGSTRRQVTVASWVWPRRGGGLPDFGDRPKRQDQPWLRVQFKDGQVTSKERLTSGAVVSGGLE